MSLPWSGVLQHRRLDPRSGCRKSR